MTASPTAEFVPADLDATKWANLEPLYAALLERDIATVGDLETLLLDRSELDAAAREAIATLYIRMTCHTDDDDARDGYLDYVNNVSPQLSRTSFELDKKIVASPFRDELPDDRYGVMLRDLTADVELFRDENVPLETEDTQLAQKYSEVAGAMTVEFRGEERTMPQMAVFLEETDRDTREAAWRGISERRLQDRDTFDDLFDQMVKLRHQQALNAGFANYRDYMFKAKHRFDYTPEDCAAYHDAAAEVCVPVMRALNDQRRDALGVDTLRPWDLGVDPQGRDPLRPFNGADELVTKTSALFHQLDPRLGGMFDQLRDGRSLDLETRKGKAPGGYQESFDRQRRPFIFMNAAGMHRDLETMIHEAGHAFHTILSREDPLVHYRHAPIEFAEVASMSMELLAHPYLGQFYSDADGARAKRTHLEALSRLIPWTATVDAFQHWIYTNPEHTREERTAKWLELDERFGAALDWSGLETFRESTWHRQLHIFEVPFYYIEYGIAQLGALQLWLASQRDEPAAIASYMDALALGGSRPLPDLFAAAGLDFDFSAPTVRTLMDAVQRELETLPA